MLYFRDCFVLLVLVALRIGAQCPERCSCPSSLVANCSSASLTSIPNDRDCFLLLVLVALRIGAQCPEPCSCPSSFVANCSSASLTSIPNDRCTINTQILDISCNRLSYLNKTSLRNMGINSLKELNASRNSISDIHDEAFVGQSRLQTLDLSNNNLSFIEPKAFICNPSLEWLSLSGNGFGMLPEEGYFLYSSSLSVLHLSACNLRHIPTRTFHGLPNLQELYISHNFIDILPPLGTGFLTVLDVSNNNLRDLDSDTFTSSPKIIRLNLSYNRLRTLNIEMLPQLAKVIRTGDLIGNPWFCDCVMYNTTYSWCRDNGVELNLTCSGPPKFKDQKWTLFDSEGCVENIFDEVDEFTVSGNGLSKFEEHAKYETQQESGDVLRSREQVTEFELNYFYTSLALFGLLIVLTAVAASMFCYLRRSRASMRMGPALNDEEESHLSSI